MWAKKRWGWESAKRGGRTTTPRAHIAGTDTAWPRGLRRTAWLRSCWGRRRDIAGEKAARCTLPIRKREIWERTRLSEGARESLRERRFPRRSWGRNK